MQKPGIEEMPGFKTRANLSPPPDLWYTALGDTPASFDPMPVIMPLTLEDQRLRSLEDACLCAKLAEDFRGRDTVVLDLTDVTPIVDYFVITTGANPRQMRALLEEVRLVMKSRGSASRGIEGDGDSAWLLMDYGDIVLHVFQPAAREMYDLERLWADARTVDWRAQLGVAPAPVAERL